MKQKPKRKKTSRVSRTALPPLVFDEKKENSERIATLESWRKFVDANIAASETNLRDAVRKEVIAQRFAEFCEKPVPWYLRLFRKKPKLTNQQISASAMQSVKHGQSLHVKAEGHTDG
jgi:hypothetical protein